MRKIQNPLKLIEINCLQCHPPNRISSVDRAPPSQGEALATFFRKSFRQDQPLAAELFVPDFAAGDLRDLLSC
jgi:hypothetical protein